MIKTINVTKQDIEDGKRCESGFCPVALAIKREINDDSTVAVGPDNVIFSKWCEVEGCHDSVERDLSFEVSEWTGKFDCGRVELEEIEFELDIPEEFLKV